MNSTTSSMNPITKLSFGKSSSLENIKNQLQEVTSSSTIRLELIDCIATADDVTFGSHVQPALPVDLVSLTITSGQITSAAVSKITSKCSKIQQLRFINCPLLDRQSISAIGANCHHLKSLSIIYDAANNWTRSNEQVLSLLVKVCDSELNSLAMVGFDSVSDIEVAYVAECYGASLKRLNLSRSRQLTDKSLESLAERCKGLSEVSFNSTVITDKGVVTLVNSCPRLRRLEFGNCSALTDQATKAISTKCPKLERISVEYCPRITDQSLTSLVKRCRHLQHIDFSGTSISNITPLILALQKLKILKAHDCTRLVQPPPDVASRGIDHIKDYFRFFNVPCRWRVNFVGEKRCGKTSIIRGLMSSASSPESEPKENTPMIDRSSEDGQRSSEDMTKSYFWQPEVTSDVSSSSRPSSEDKKSTGSVTGSVTDARSDTRRFYLELIEYTARPVCQAINHLLFGSRDVYVVVFNVKDKFSCDKIPSHINSIQHRAPGSRLILVGTHQDEMQPTPSQDDENVDKRLQDILYSIKDAEGRAMENIKSEINSLCLLPADPRVQHEIDRLRQILSCRPKIPTALDIIMVNSINKEGFAALQSAILRDVQLVPNNSSPSSELRLATISLLELVAKLKNAGNIVVQWYKFSDMALKSTFISSEVDLEQEISHLHSVGIIIDIKSLVIGRSSIRDDRYICLSPVQLIRVVTSLHIEDDGKAFRVDAKKFWPREKGWTRPRPQLLLNALGDIVKYGVIRECLLPIILQEYSFNESQICDLTKLFVNLGFLTSLAPIPASEEQHTATLKLFEYESFSQHRAYYLPLTNLCPDRRPGINWTSRPSKGDMHVSWRYEFPNGIPYGLKNRLIAVCMASVSGMKTYRLMWRQGVLFKIGQAAICVEYETKRLDISCRVNADAPEQVLTSSEYLWSHLAPFIIAVQQLLDLWAGLLYKVNLMPVGLPLFGGDVVANDRCFSLFYCLQMSGKEENIKFIDGSVERQLDVKILIPYNVNEISTVIGWIKRVYNNRETVFSILENDSLDQTCLDNNNYYTSPSKILQSDQGSLINGAQHTIIVQTQRPVKSSDAGNGRSCKLRWIIDDQEADDCDNEETLDAEELHDILNDALTSINIQNNTEQCNGVSNDVTAWNSSNDVSGVTWDSFSSQLTNGANKLPHQPDGANRPFRHYNGVSENDTVGTQTEPSNLLESSDAGQCSVTIRMSEDEAKLYQSIKSAYCVLL